MVHKNKIAKLGRKKSHRVSLVNNLMKSLIIHEKIDTTVTKAAVLKARIDKLMTLAKSSERTIAEKKVNAILNDKKVTAMIFDKYLPEYKDLNSGYTQRVLLGNRLGDNAPIARVAWKGKLEI